jgi:hypothetical protein
MRTLLHDTKRGMYYRGDGQWTRDHQRALDFKLIDRAVGHVREAGLLEVELVFAFSDPSTLARVPLARVAVRYANDSA